MTPTESFTGQENLAVGDVAVALAHFRADALDAEGEVRPAP
jgi:hypothetical protein